ncbi:sodium- and chloride-dependent GABA transporter 1-like [Babylonia areolata]|uniref:sodium- and chloride-dependent GABA transporter 1-like n=1 Tax=Babylonia areolata TaxID=304850 RepID=UPI003FD3286A
MDHNTGAADALTSQTAQESNEKETKVHPEHLHLHHIDPSESVQTSEAKDDKKEEEEKKDPERMQWSSKREYILSAIGYCVGIGNLFRFPYLCNRNGGGVFLIPFLSSLILIGLPLFAIEAVLGQFSGRNCQNVWAICPLFKGAGLGMVITSTVCFWYYNTIMAWAFYYLASSFRSVLPWALCGEWWNTPHCFTYLEPGNTSSASENTSSVLEVSSSVLVNTSYAIGNVTGTGSDLTPTKKFSSAEEFWKNNVLQLSRGLDEPGSVVWHLALTLTLTLLICFLALMKGVQSSGKVAYVTATAPYILLTVLLVRGATLPGAVDGILFYIKPDFAKLLEPQVWVEAAMQVFFSLGPCWGGIQVMASFNKFHNNCLRDAVVLALVSEATSIYAGFVIFSVLGYIAYMSEQSIHNVVSSGPGLAFIVYPEAVALMPLPQIWAVLFFIMIITVAIDSQITTAEVGLTAIIDLYPRLLHRRRPVVTAIFCFVFLLISLPFVTQGGMYVFQLVDWFVATVSIIFIGILECVVVGWIYGIQRFGDDIHLMLGKRPPFILCLFWKYITPCLLLVLLIITFLNYTPPTLGDYVYGPGGTAFGWCVAFSSFLPIPAVALHQLWKAEGSLIQRLRHTLKPDYNVWKPADVTARLEYRKGFEHNI